MAPEIYQGIVAYQSGDSTAAWTLVQKFTPLLKHYAFILHREDGFEDLQCYFLSLLKTLSLERLSSTSDGAIIKHIAISMHIFVFSLQTSFFRLWLDIIEGGFRL